MRRDRVLLPYIALMYGDRVVYQAKMKKGRVL
jgi:hypothetical protein